MTQTKNSTPFRLACLLILVVLLCSSLVPGDVTPGRTTSLRNRVQRKLEDVVDSFTDMLNGPRVNPERAPTVFDEREGGRKQ